MFENLFTRNGLSLDRLRSFLEVSQAGSIAKAAVGDLSRQALISRQIRELEDFFGTELTLRRGKSLTLSAAGTRLAHLIQEQFQDLNDFQCDQQKLSKTFCIGAGASVLEWFVTPVAAKIRRSLGQPTLRLVSQRSTELVENVRDGRLDFAIVREDAIPEALPRLPLVKMKFHICVARELLGSLSKAALNQPTTLQTLPFVAYAGGGQLDHAFRQSMSEVCGAFHPAYECDSLLQVRELVVQGVCAGLLPTLGTRHFASTNIVVSEFGPLKGYGRGLVLHWNERQMRRRGVEQKSIHALAAALRQSRI